MLVKKVSDGELILLIDTTEQMIGVLLMLLSYGRPLICAGFE